MFNSLINKFAVDTYFDWGTDQTPIGIVMTIFNIVSGAVVMIIIGGIIFGGVQYSMAGGDEGKVKAAKTTITNCGIALILYLAMFAVLNFLVPGGLFR